MLPTRALALAAMVASALDSADAQQWATLDAFLEHGIRLAPAQRSALARGEIVTKLLPSSEVRNVAVFAAVQVRVPRAVFVDRQRELLLDRADGPPHVFGNPATAADVRAIAVTDEDLAELRNCRANDCGFKLPASDMQAFRPGEASGPDARARITEIVRRRMLDYVADYRARGNAAMLVVDDRGSVRSSDALDAMLRDSSFAFRAVPSLGRFLVGYPRDTLAGATEAIYWAVAELARVKPVLRIMHAVLYTPSDVAGASVLASKQVYANHYFEAGLETLTAVDRPDGITLVAIRRYRFDNLPSGGLLNLRGRVRNALQDDVQAYLGRLKREYEGSSRP